MTFVLAAYQDGDVNGGGVLLDVDLHTANKKGGPQPASNAILYGLAILMLEQQGVIDQTICAIIDNGVPSEAEVVARINLLLKDDANHAAA